MINFGSELIINSYFNKKCLDITNGQNNGKLNIRENPLQLFSDNSGIIENKIKYQ